MSKIQKIQVKNFKAVESQETDFRGCSAIITAGNNKGKTSFLKGLIDRLRGERPELVLRNEEKEGYNLIELTSGEKFEWTFAKNEQGVLKEKLVFVSKDNKKTDVTANMKQSVGKSLCEQFFPPEFDIDKFLTSSPLEQSKSLQKLVGLDFTEIEKEYKEAYENRTYANKFLDSKKVELENIKVKFNTEGVDITKAPEKEIDIVSLQKSITDLQYSNSSKQIKEQELQNTIDKKNSLLEKIINDDNTYDKQISEYQAEIEKLKLKIENAKISKQAQKDNSNKQLDIYDTQILEQRKEIEVLSNNNDTENKIKDLQKQFNEASETNKLYQKKKMYDLAFSEFEAATKSANDCQNKVLAIEKRKKEMIASANMPVGFSFDENYNILVDGFPLDKKQISSSKLYISALRLASLNLGQVRTIYFDASTLDKNSLEEIYNWSKENDLQLLIERPDYDGGEIRIEFIGE